MSATVTTEKRELAYRSIDGLDIQLLWDRATDVITIAVTDHKHGGCYEQNVAPSDALDAFAHPFAYMGHRVATTALDGQ